jgi:hypothetical protein
MDRAGVAKRPRERIPHPNPYASDFASPKMRVDSVCGWRGEGTDRSHHIVQRTRVLRHRGRRRRRTIRTVQQLTVHLGFGRRRSRKRVLPQRHTSDKD